MLEPDRSLVNNLQNNQEPVKREEDYDITEHLNMDMFDYTDHQSIQNSSPSPLDTNNNQTTEPNNPSEVLDYEFGKCQIFQHDKDQVASINYNDFDPQYFQNKDPSMKYSLQVGDIPSKSRVETQIKVMLNLFPAPTETAVHLPADTISKPKYQLKSPFEPNPSVLTIETIVVCDSDPRKHVNMCLRCIKREKKRASRKKTRLPVEEEHWNEERPKRVVIFNCKEVVEFGDYVETQASDSNGTTTTIKGRQVALPMRLACYCRHHNEKSGFKVYFLIRDSTGTVVARGSTTPVMITDDHKALVPLPQPPQNQQSMALLSSSSASSPSASSPLSAMQSAASSDTNGAYHFPPPSAGRKRKKIDDNDDPRSDHQQHKNQFSRFTFNTDFQNRSAASSSSALSTTGGGGGGAATLTPPESAYTSPSFQTTSLPHHQQHQPRNSYSSSGVLSPNSAFSTPSTAGTSPQSSSEKPGPSSSISGSFAMNMPNTSSNSPHQFLSSTSSPFGSSSSSGLPAAEKVIPTSGPIQGGIDVTILGTGFYSGINAKFGEHVAIETTCWNSTTLVAILPPTQMAGPVTVSFQGWPIPEDKAQIFTYVDESEQQLIELALQVVGLTMNGQLQDAREIARRIVGESDDIDGGALQQKLGGGSANGAKDDAEQHEHVLMQLLDLLDNEDLGNYFPYYDLQNKQGQTMLQLAAFCGMTDFVEALIERGASLDVKDMNGMTALHFACLNGKLDVIDHLVEDPSDLSDERCDGLTPLDLLEEEHRSSVLSRHPDHDDDEDSSSDEEVDESNEEALVRAVSRADIQGMGTRIAGYLSDSLNKVIPDRISNAISPAPPSPAHATTSSPPAYEEIFPSGHEQAIDYSNAVIDGDFGGPGTGTGASESGKTLNSGIATPTDQHLKSDQESPDDVEVLKVQRRQMNHDRMLHFFWVPMLLFTLAWIAMKAVSYMDYVEAKGITDRILAVGRSLSGFTTQITTRRFQEL